MKERFFIPPRPKPCETGGRLEFRRSSFHLEGEFLIDRSPILRKTLGDGLEPAGIAGGVYFQTAVGPLLHFQDGVPVQELSQVLSLSRRNGAVVGDRIGDALEVHHAHIGGEPEGRDVILFGDEIDDPVDGRLSHNDGLVVDVDVLEEHRVEIQEKAEVAQDHAVHHHENVVRPVETAPQGIPVRQEQHRLPADAAEGEFGDDLHDDLPDGREAGVVIQVVPARGHGGEKEVFAVGHERGQRVGPERFPAPEGGFPRHQVRPLGGTQAQAGQPAGIGPEDRELEESLSGKRVIALLNKCDLAKTPEVLSGSENGSGREHAAGLENWGRAAEGGPILFSAKDGTGLKELKERVEDMFFAGKLNDSEDAWVANARQRTALAAARTSLGLVAESIRAGVPEDMYTIDLADAYRELGYIIGEEVEDELIDKIFADFCMGK